MEKFVEVKKLSMNLANNIKLFDSLNLDVCRGDFVCVFGNRGVGKSRLLDIIAGLDGNYTGDVRVCGGDRRRISNRDLKVSYMMKKPVFFENKTVEDNLAYVFFEKFCKLTDDKKCIVDDAIRKFGFESYRKNRIKKLEFWQKKMLNLARIFCKGSDLILIDELFYGVNCENFCCLARGVELIAGDKSKTIICVGNVPNFAYFKYSKYIYLNFCTKKEFKSVSDVEENFDDIFSYFLVRHGVEFQHDEGFLKKYGVEIFKGEFIEKSAEIVLPDHASIQVARGDLINIYLDASEIYIFKVDGYFFDFETGLLLSR